MGPRSETWTVRQGALIRELTEQGRRPFWRDGRGPRGRPDRRAESGLAERLNEQRL
jgi:hypothetical protein